jgi:hypothetical protein
MLNHAESIGVVNRQYKEWFPRRRFVRRVAPNHACLTASIGSTRSHGNADKHVMTSASPITAAVTGRSTVHSTAPIR